MNPSAPSARILRGYGPLLAFAVLFCLMAAFVPTVGDEVRTVPAEATPGGDSAVDGQAGDPTAPGADGEAEAPGSPAAAASSPPRPGTAPVPGRGGTRTSRPGSPAAPGGLAVGSGAAGAVVAPCPERTRQVPNDPYSPPCITFSGDNGGATGRGVTGDKISISVRLFEFPEMSIGPDDGPQRTFTFKKEDLKTAVSGLTEYFNSRFQFYGRKLEPAFFDGKGDIMAEFQGAGQEQAEADAVKAVEEIKPFAELFSITTPYSDALSRRALLNIGAPVMSREWYAARRPFAWTAGPDCTFVLEAISDYLLKRVVHRPAAYAGGGLKDKERSIGLIVPDNPWYQECADAGEKILREQGAPPRLRLAYKLDINTLSNQAASMVAKLRDAGVTTVVCGCDPVLPVFLTSKAQEQSYEPEWVVAGTAFMDTDGVGQLYQQDQWSRAFGLSFLGPPQPLRGSYGYFAFKAVRPDEEPIELVDLLYYQLYLVALGVQMAGPDLTPETFEAGLYAYPGGTGPAGTWRFTPGRHSPVQDGREIYWDRNRTSRLNDKKGAYVETEPGRRYRPGEWPASDPAVFRGSAE